MVRPPEPAARGLVAVLGATAIAGASGYAIQLLAARLLADPHDYLSFSVFWSTMYLIGSAVGGIQQEVARAAAPVLPEAPPGALRGFVAAASVVVVAVAVLVGVSVAPIAFAGTGAGMAGALAVGLLGYVATSVLTGLLYGLHRLPSVAALIVVDAVLRAAAVTLALALSAPPDVVALAVAMPFGIAVLVVWVMVRPRVRGMYALDVSPVRLACNTAHTVAAAAATGVMVTGMPLLLRLSLADATVSTVAALTLVITLTRAPFIIPLMALQSYLTVVYRDAPARAEPRMLRYLAVAAAAAVAAGALAWLVVPWAIELISVGRYAVSPWTSSIIVVSAVLVGSLCVTGPLLLARKQHRAYAAGWLWAAVSTIVLLALLPLAAQPRVVTALVLAPAIGLIVHLAAVRWGHRPAVRKSAPDSE
ncbi:hypothetical protein ITJ43_06015 [Microbacterium sp. VKM Ac-2870]|uniref:hypothetical protein n=1 Tax=Microbacterium sp. VKM Ac-2870 TaxID=2783825 RepID=UPI00188CEA97|nr:hypothetical protein [Microbacterium sp. VKM Ac-2870]MBF4561690.1 hypothetical protein [Microbacterium sp. VKM Ac-2870]